MRFQKSFFSEQFGNIRIVINESNEPLFCLADVCKALELNNPSAVKSRLKSSGMQLIDNHALNFNEGVIINKLGNRQTTFINEANLYKCIFQSKKAEAEKFQDWVTLEILPSIRKHGAYMTSEIIEKALLDPDMVIQLATTLKEERQKRFELESKNKEMKPKVLFADAVSASKRSCSVAELAKIITQNGVNMGQNRLFTWFRENGYLCKRGSFHNQPTQKAMEMELFEIKQTSINKPDGTILVSTTTKVTGKGQIYFVEKFLKNNIR